MENIKLKKKFETAIREITNKLIAGYNPERIILFGSSAKGSYNENSDIDMLIIKRTDKKRYIDRWIETREIARYLKYGVSFEPHVYTPEEFQNRLELGDFFLEEILETGKTLYEK